VDRLALGKRSPGELEFHEPDAASDASPIAIAPPFSITLISYTSPTHSLPITYPL
jgi:hypothetical protein